MKVLGLIVEYNPFHNGHLYHLKRSVEIIKPDYVIAVMSGHFTQRGEAAVIDKWLRAEMALSSGIDLVLELPAVFAVQTAEIFAHAGVEILNHTGLVTHMAFGSEIGRIEPLWEIAEVLAKEPPAYRELLKNHLGKGLPFPRARHYALLDYFQKTKNNSEILQPMEQILENPNSILGLEYLKALIRTGSSIKPFTFSRIHAGYHEKEISGTISSATAIRHELFTRGMTPALQQALPRKSYEILKRAVDMGRGPVSNHSLEQLLLGILRRASSDEIAEWVDVEEGLENRMKSAALQARSLDDFLNRVKTKRYVYTRIQRILIHGLLGMTKKKLKLFKASGPQYLRILGFRKEASPLLKELKKASRVPVITKPAHYRNFNHSLLEEMFEMDILSTDLYSLGLANPDFRIAGRDLLENSLII